MKRIVIALLLWGALLPGQAARAESPEKVHRVGWLGVGAADKPNSSLEALRLGLRDLGYVEGRTYVFEQRWWNGKPGELPALARSLESADIDVLVAQGLAVWGVTGVTRVPVVYGYSGDPVAAGFAQSLARPGGNMTGATYMAIEINGKRLELIREILPAIKRVAILSNPQHPGEAQEIDESRAAAKGLGLRLHYLPVRSAEDVTAALTAIGTAQDQAIIGVPDAGLGLHRARIAAFARQARLPVVFGWKNWIEPGALLTYGPSQDESWRNVAPYVDRVLKGAKPADLPIMRPSRFELTINLKTAKALGIAIPESVLSRADEVIE